MASSPELRICSPEEMEALGARLARGLHAGDTVCLYGEMGAGKSVIARAIAGALGVGERMPSPTYTLVAEYITPSGLRVLHLDLYRLGGDEEYGYLGVDDLQDEAVTLVEWPERAPSLTESPHHAVHIRLDGPDCRLVSLKGFPAGAERA